MLLQISDFSEVEIVAFVSVDFLSNPQNTYVNCRAFLL